MKPIPDGAADEMVVETTPDMGVKHLPMPMYSTPTMVGHFEALCLKMMIPYLNPGESSVGYKVNIKHSAPTPIGMKVTIKAKVIESDETQGRLRGRGLQRDRREDRRRQARAPRDRHDSLWRQVLTHDRQASPRSRRATSSRPRRSL